MTIYLILIIVLLILGIGIKPRKSGQREKAFLFISFLLMTLISGLRDFSVGVDTISYVGIFNNIEYIDYSYSRYEHGFLYFVRLVRCLSSNPSLLLLISSVICIGTTCIFIRRFSPDPLLSVLLYIVLKPYFFQMTGMRQAIATAIAMIAFAIILDKKGLRYLIISALLILLATQFHNMAVAAYIPFCIMAVPKIRESISATGVLKLVVIVSFIAFVFYPVVMRLVGIIAPHYYHYFSGVWGASNYFAALVKMLIQLLFLVVGVYLIRNKKLSDIERFALIMVGIAVISETLSMRMTIWGRLTGMFSIYTGVIFAPVVGNSIFDGRSRLLLKCVIFVFSFAYMLVTFIFRPEWDGVVPYLFR